MRSEAEIESSSPALLHHRRWHNPRDIVRRSPSSTEKNYETNPGNEQKKEAIGCGTQETDPRSRANPKRKTSSSYFEISLLWVARRAPNEPASLRKFRARERTPVPGCPGLIRCAHCAARSEFSAGERPTDSRYERNICSIRSTTVSCSNMSPRRAEARPTCTASIKRAS